MRALFRNRNYRIYLLGSTVDSIGDMAFWLAAAIWVKELTGSTAELGVCILMINLGTLLSPATGVLVDRLRRKRTLMVTNALTALALLSLLAVRGPGQVWLIFTVMFCYGLSSAITNAAFSGLKQQLMPKDLFAEANGLAQAIQQGSRLITPGIGLGLLAAFGGHVLAVMDAATFGFGLLCWSLVRIEDPKPQPPAPQERPGWWAESSAGFRYLFGTPLLRQLTAAFALALFAMGFLETLVIPVATVGLHHAPTWVGVLVTMMGVTGLAGGVLAGSLVRRIGPGMVTALGLALAGAACLAMAAPVTWIVLGAAALLGFGLPMAIVGSVTAVQLFTPNELMGRVSGADNLLVTSSQCIGIAVCAAAVGEIFYRDLCYFVGGVIALSALYLASRKAQRQGLPADAAGSDGSEASGAPASAVEGTSAAEPTPA
ncbi:MFS transporter [Actinospica durhamensis]|uniref:MFS transporter n=1 Tax=Actinospica durhamensis TaxID=1508375 RepID=A0A941EJW3_9ACTN|nr:MFS transporter [Actinospica durhamensis]MBR7832150.1 MFS transporter [Actinospica durhamensis]